MPSDDDSGVTHGVTCENCGGETFAYEKFCHLCGANRWSE